jgi:hypothetical protein
MMSADGATSPMVLKPNHDTSARQEVPVVHIDEIKIVVLQAIEAEKKRRGIIDAGPDQATLPRGITFDPAQD